MNRTVEVSYAAHTALGLCLLLLVGLGAGSWACSVCIAHAFGAGQAGVGAQLLEKGKLVVAFSNYKLRKSNAGELEGTREAHSEFTTSLDVLYGMSQSAMLRANIPYVHKRIGMTDEPEESATGLGDAAIGWVYQLKPKRGSRILTALSLDVKLPTGENDARDGGGDFVEQHLQLGSGSTDISAGVIWTWQAGTSGALWFGGLKYRRNGENDRDFHYGNVLFYNIGHSQPLVRGDSLVYEFNGRFAGKDRREDGSQDENSGGHLGYLSFSYRRPMSGSAGLIASVQVPVLSNLYGSQTEKAMYSLSLSQVW